MRLRSISGHHLLGGLTVGLVMTALAVLAPSLATQLQRSPAPPSPAPTVEPTPPPAAVLLPEELDKDLQGVMILVNDRTYGTAFQIDPAGDFLTAAAVVNGSAALRLVDNTGGSHPVRIIGIDASLGVAEIRASADGVPLAFGDSNTVKPGDPLVLLASPKVLDLRSATPAVASGLAPGTIAVRSDDLPGEIGGPLVGPGGTVLALFMEHGRALPIASTRADIASWHGQAGTLLPLAALPADLVLRGTNDTTTPTLGVTLQLVSPTRASANQTTLVTLQGDGFRAGPTLSVRFVPVASPSGAFTGISPTVVSSSSVNVKVPAGQVVQDYVIEYTNGDGSVATFHTAFTVTP